MTGGSSEIWERCSQNLIVHSCEGINDFGQAVGWGIDTQAYVRRFSTTT